MSESRQVIGRTRRSSCTDRGCDETPLCGRWTRAGVRHRPPSSTPFLRSAPGQACPGWRTCAGPVTGPVIRDARTQTDLRTALSPYAVPPPRRHRRRGAGAGGRWACGCRRPTFSPRCCWRWCYPLALLPAASARGRASRGGLPALVRTCLLRCQARTRRRRATRRLRTRRPPRRTTTVRASRSRSPLTPGLCSGLSRTFVQLRQCGGEAWASSSPEVAGQPARKPATRREACHSRASPLMS